MISTVVATALDYSGTKPRTQVTLGLLPGAVGSDEV
jgi:hypothetical protein